MLVDYRGLNVEEDTELRRKLREANVKYFVIKNTLLRLAAKEVGLDALDEALHGPTAIAVSSEDAVAPAKVIADFAKENDKLEIKTGFMDGAVISLDEVNTACSYTKHGYIDRKDDGKLELTYFFTCKIACNYC